jgi:hypothetical protein
VRPAASVLAAVRMLCWHHHPHFVRYSNRVACAPPDEAPILSQSHVRKPVERHIRFQLSLYSYAGLHYSSLSTSIA